ncbi:MAG: adenine deaminase [Thaumarchaeota archaeon]|nr:adenine deaminase [Nitrososphaerota archaeon]
MGEKNADMVLKNCKLVNVYSREVISGSNVAILKDRIAYVGANASHTIGEKTVVIDLQEKFVTPGFADPHIHMDQFVLPSEFAKKALLCGTTSLFSDPIDMVSVCGYKGFKEFIKIAENLPIRLFHMIPGGLPVDRKFSHAKALSLTEEKSALNLKNVLGLGEVFSWTKVTMKDPKTMQTLKNMIENDCVINGHTAGASDKKLNAYISSGILSCHEPIDYDQVVERLRHGMWIMMREGSIRRDLDKIIPDVLSHKTYLDRLMFCSDGVNPKDLLEFGLIDHCVRKSIALGMDKIDAISIASKNCFDYYNMGRDYGGIAPGKMADILVFDDLDKLKPKKVFVGGKLVVSHGEIVTKFNVSKIPKWITKTVKIRRKFIEKDFVIKSLAKSVKSMVIKLDTEIITKKDYEELQTRDGNVTSSFDRDVWKVAAIDRTHGTGKFAVGFLKNFGADIGAFASTQSFHENDMIVIGSNEKDMAFAANKLFEVQGGIIAVKNQKILAIYSLPVAGLISKLPFENVLLEFSNLNAKIVDAGCKFKNPYLIPLFLPFLALPEVRILYSGIVDIKNRTYIDILNHPTT